MQTNGDVLGAKATNIHSDYYGKRVERNNAPVAQATQPRVAHFHVQSAPKTLESPSRIVVHGLQGRQNAVQDGRIREESSERFCGRVGRESSAVIGEGGPGA